VLTISEELFSFPCSVSKEVHGKLGEDTASMADPNWAEGYSISYDIMPSI